jgi:antitoxin component of RelBE/YafQ-DinJ toxin-antitoxin module
MMLSWSHHGHGPVPPAPAGERATKNLDNLINLKRPPAPPRETARTRQALPLRVDAGLVRAFHEACKRLGLKQSELIEMILWNALGEPPLSFEHGATTEQEGLQSEE